MNDLQMRSVGRAAAARGCHDGSRRAVAVFALASVVSVASTSTRAADLTSAQWTALQKNAQSIVDTESPASALPFTISTALIGTGRRPIVFAHYFTPFPLSIDNLPARSDYYCTEYLNRSGEGSKYASVGGYLRDRPLPLARYTTNVYKQRALAVEILRARKIDIDGFGVDLLQINSGSLWDDVMRVYSVAQHVAPDFKILAEPDMAALDGVSVSDMVAAIRVIAGQKNAYRMADGSLAIAPFYAENVSQNFWSDVIRGAAAAGVNVTLIPILLDPAKSADFRTITNSFSFWGVRTVPESTDKGGWEDQALTNLESFGADIMTPVAPQDSRPKDSVFWEAQNSALFRAQWSQVTSRDPAYVQLVTWNDYSESTHVSPSVGTQYAFYDLAAYYIEWAKTGNPPPIVRDSILYFHRRQIFTPGRSSTPETAMVEEGVGSVVNDIEMVAFLTAPAVLRITSGGTDHTSNGVAGLNVFRVPAVSGVPSFAIIRNGATVAQVTSTTSIVSVGAAQDPLYIGGGSARSPVSLVCSQ
ncbi:endo-1,3-alpha-glucanase family glycosylhydrolase [Caballeronia sp. GAFFF3]|uniref:endo-1,3-alpha-glucanase family glycosylhydrolase n=1 Tax=Caballeronia sp. GAFFF3 TaxID=2921759 RepID=UPI0020296A1D|nr:endo-1,3-alpha-glucanase family glycosylhydrolase [Caballeronia sp. GAFFF3]